MTTEIDISSEEYRIYTYPDGTAFRIDDPDTLWITESGSHRVASGDGLVHRPERGWVGITWMPLPGQPKFVA